MGFTLVRTGVVERMVERTVEPTEPIDAVSPDADVEMADAGDMEKDAEAMKSKTTTQTAVDSAEKEKEEKKPLTGVDKMKAAALHGVNQDIHDDLEQLELDIQANAEKFDPK